jgi:hypothetical protein
MNKIVKLISLSLDFGNGSNISKREEILFLPEGDSAVEFIPLSIELIVLNLSFELI